MRELLLYEEFSREDVHGIFAPGTNFTPQAGTWGLQGVVQIPDRPGDYVFFVTFGKTQGDHTFDEGITEDGVLSWQSQPRQTLDDPRVLQWISHNEFVNNIYLFLRTDDNRKYAFLGRLKYLEHDKERERPIYFQWQILDWLLSSDMHTGLIRLWIATTLLAAATVGWYHAAELKSFVTTFNLTWDRDAHNKPIIERYAKCVAGADEKTLAARADECTNAEKERIIGPTYYPWKWAALTFKISLLCALLELAFFYVWLGFKRKTPR